MSNNTLNNFSSDFSSTFASLVERYSMDPDTILFLRKDRRAYAYNYSYYQDHIEEIRKQLDVDEADKITHIFYKVNRSRDSWIDFNKAIKLNEGTISERIMKAFYTDSQKVPTIKMIPECVFTDKKGYMYKIMPYDGLYSIDSWIKLIHFDGLENTTYEIVDNNVIVTFPENVDIRNAIISLNKYFYPFNILSKNQVVFKNVVDELKRVATMNTQEDSIIFNTKIYAWENVTKENTLVPISHNGFIFNFDRTIGENGILIYNNAIYDYDLDFETYRSLTIKGLNPEFENEIDISLVRFIPLSYNDGVLQIRKFFSNGIANRYHNRVNFLHPVINSIITYENLDHEYEVLDMFSIYYPQSIYSVEGVKVERNINAINFYLRQVGLNDFLPDGKGYTVIQPMLDTFLSIIDTLGQEQDTYFDFDDIITVDRYEPHLIHLSKIPLGNTIKLVINGVVYIPRKHFIYHESSNTIEWKFTFDNGGFDLNNNYVIDVIYNYSKSENGE